MKILRGQLARVLYNRRKLRPWRKGKELNTLLQEESVSQQDRFVVVISEIGIPTYPKSALFKLADQRIRTKHNKTTDRLPNPKRESSPIRNGNG